MANILNTAGRAGFPNYAMPKKRTVIKRDYQWIENAVRISCRSEFKPKVVREVLREDKTLSQMAAAHGVHPTMLSVWRDQALIKVVSLFSRAEENDWVDTKAANK